MTPRIDAALNALTCEVGCNVLARDAAAAFPKEFAGLKKVAAKATFQPAGGVPRPPRPPKPVGPGGGGVGFGGASATPWRQPGSTLGSPQMTMPRAGGPPASPAQGMAAAQQRFNGAQPQPQAQFRPAPPPQPQRAPAVPQQGIPGTTAFGGRGAGTATSTPAGWISPRARAAEARDREVNAALAAAAKTPVQQPPAQPAFKRLDDPRVNLNTASDDDMRAWLRSQGLL